MHLAIRIEKVRSIDALKGMAGMVYILGNTLEVVTCQTRQSNLRAFKRVTGGMYLDQFGTSHSCNKTTTRDQQMSSLRRSFTRLRRLIRANFSGTCSEIHAILTYSGDQNWDAQQLSKDVKAFWRKLRRKYPNVQYIAISDPHSMGAWHSHMLLKDITGKRLYITKSELETLWGKGLVRVRSLSRNHEIAGYFYKKLFDSNRLSYYPSSCKLYHCSKGIVRPKGILMPRDEIDAFIRDGHYSFKRGCTYQILREDEEGYLTKINEVIREEYYSG